MISRVPRRVVTLTSPRLKLTGLLMIRGSVSKDPFEALALPRMVAVITQSGGVVPRRDEGGFSSSVVGAGGWVARSSPMGPGVQRFLCCVLSGVISKCTDTCIAMQESLKVKIEVRGSLL